MDDQHIYNMLAEMHKMMVLMNANLQSISGSLATLARAAELEHPELVTRDLRRR